MGPPSYMRSVVDRNVVMIVVSFDLGRVKMESVPAFLSVVCCGASARAPDHMTIRGTPLTFSTRSDSALCLI